MDKPKKKSITAGKVLLFSVLFLLVIMGLFVLIMSHMSAPGDLSATTNQYTKADLGTIGDFIGGLLNPILTFFTVCLLVWSIHIQRRELKAATDVLTQTKDVHANNIKNEEKNFISKVVFDDLDQLRLASTNIIAPKQFSSPSAGGIIEKYSLDDLAKANVSASALFNARPEGQLYAHKVIHNNNFKLKYQFMQIEVVLLMLVSLVHTIKSRQLDLSLFQIKTRLMVHEIKQILSAFSRIDNLDLNPQILKITELCHEITQDFEL